ncbi:MAG: isochorismatase family protein [Opitutales bacterium]|nr:isochorismatase family protein [Opitutales bacterium]MCH8539251.1 cysteine hydrolase [Opitutales bacterium]
MENNESDALLVIDPQHAFLNSSNKGLWHKIEEDLFPRFARRAYTQFMNSPESPVWQAKGWEGCLGGSEESRMLWETNPASPKVVVFRKTGFTGVSEDFLQWLERQAIQRIFLCGGDTDLCVMRTLIDLAHRKIPVVLLADYCFSSAGPEMHRYAVIQAKRFLGSRGVVGALDE